MVIRSGQAGFNLVEVLVALVILAFGLLGIASLQITGVRGTQGSYFRSQAVAFANEFAERMYMNPTAVRSGQYANLDSKDMCDGGGGSACGAEAGSSGDKCAPDEMAAYDLLSVACGYPGAGGKREGGANTALPGGRMTVECIDQAGAPDPACPAGSRHRVTVEWQDRASVDAAGLFELSTQNVTLTVQP